MKLATAVLAVLVTGSPWALAQSVHVVDASNGAGTDFTSLSAAISAASDGDALLIRSGAYSSAVINGKSLVLQADSSSTVSVIELDIRNLSASQSVCVFGLTVIGCDDRVDLLNNQGSVWFERCTISGGVTITTSDSVVFTRCITGAPGTACSGWRFAIRSSTVNLYTTIVNGFTDGSGGVDGLPGIEITDGSLYLHGSTVLGGDGLDVGGNCPSGTDGGAGIVMIGNDPEVIRLGSQVSGGNGCASGPAPSIDDTSSNGTITSLPGVPRSLTVGSPVREQQTSVLTYMGRSGDFVRLVYSLDKGPRMGFGPLTGFLLLGNPVFTSPAGVVPFSGVLTQTFTFAECGPGIEVTSFYGQPLFVNPSTSEIQLGTAVQLHLFDSSF